MVETNSNNQMPITPDSPPPNPQTRLNQWQTIPMTPEEELGIPVILMEVARYHGEGPEDQSLRLMELQGRNFFCTTRFE